MIHEIGTELQAQLALNGVPFAVIDGPEATTTTTAGRERIVVEHDPDAADAFSDPRSQHRNPMHRYTRSAAYKLTIYAQSTVTGATVFEHRRRVEKVLDKVLVAMDYVAANRKNRWRPTAGRLVTPADLEKSEKAGGSVYELKFTFDRAVEVRSWANAKAPEYTMGAGGVHSTTKVSRTGGTDNDNDIGTPPATAETACGA